MMKPALTTPRDRRNRLALLAAGLLAFALAGCESPSPRAPASPPPQPTTQSPPPAPAEQRPAEVRPAAQPPAPSRLPAQGDPPVVSAPQPDAPPAPPSPEEPPKYVRILERERSDASASLDATARGNAVVRLETNNVKRLRLIRDELPFRATRSVAVRIDQQGIEWSPRHAWIELERSRSGEWTVVARSPE